MGEVEKCPKCGMRLRHNKSEYRTVEGGALPDYYSCLICGYFKELPPEPKKLVNTVKKNSYPMERKPQNEIGWLRALVRENFELLTEYRELHGLTWKDTQIAIQQLNPKFANTNQTGLSTAYYRVREARNK